MTDATRPAWLTELINERSDHAKPGTCTRCHAPVLRARAGRIAALDVVADPQPLDAVEELLARLEGRLTWHLVTNRFGTQRITWRDQFHIRAGPAKHPVIGDHHCPPHPTQGVLL
ncbi:hypothetical protein [Streptomyces sp. NPDC001315]|uniref:hypothetical protein n=1 Tax=Streptomyces sp. NPDC001315 TaxID=3364562 RepID=UPI003699DA3C